MAQDRHRRLRPGDHGLQRIVGAGGVVIGPFRRRSDPDSSVRMRNDMDPVRENLRQIAHIQRQKRGLSLDPGAHWGGKVGGERRKARVPRRPDDRAFGFRHAGDDVDPATAQRLGQAFHRASRTKPRAQAVVDQIARGAERRPIGMGGSRHDPPFGLAPPKLRRRRFARAGQRQRRVIGNGLQPPGPPVAGGETRSGLHPGPEASGHHQAFQLELLLGVPVLGRMGGESAHGAPA